MKNKLARLIVISISILIALILSIRGVYFYTNKKTQFQVEEKRPTSLPTSISASSTVIDTISTSNWKTFIDEKYGFEFKYPSSLGKTIDQPLKYQTALDCSPSSGYDQVIATKSIEGLDVQISCDYNFDKTAPTYAEDYHSGDGTYQVIENNGKKSYLFNYVSGVGYVNQELYIPFKNGIYILLTQSNKAGQPESYPEITAEQAKGIVSTFNILNASKSLYIPLK